MKNLSVLLIVLAASVFVPACERQGPAERAGEKIDDAMSETADTAKDIGKDIDDAAKRSPAKLRKWWI